MVSSVVTKLLPPTKIVLEAEKDLEFTDEELQTMVINHLTGKGKYLITRFLNCLQLKNPRNCSEIPIICDDSIYDFYVSAKNASLKIRTLLYKSLFLDEVNNIGLISPRTQQVMSWNIQKWKISKKREQLQFLLKLYEDSKFTKEQRAEYEKINPDIGFTVRKIDESFNSDLVWQVGSELYSKPKDYKVYMHSCCEINLGKEDTYKACIKSLKHAVDEGYLGYVVHTGSNENQEEGIKNLRQNLINLMKYSTDTCPVLLENTAGQGFSLLTNLIEFTNFVKAVNVKVCFDTCHIFSAGYCPLEAFSYLNQETKIKLIHFNDSIYPIGSRKDRHIYIGKGFIGSKLIDIYKLAKNFNIDCVKEC